MSKENVCIATALLLDILQQNYFHRTPKIIMLETSSPHPQKTRGKIIIV